jgi:hypothetical protein
LYYHPSPHKCTIWTTYTDTALIIHSNSFRWCTFQVSL